MPNPVVTLFTWGYEGWGNWTDKLVAAADAVEAARGWGAPVFVDVRASREVRAEGFREKAFERRFGPDRYRWIQGLGNKAILTGEQYGSLLDPRQAADLLDLAMELHARRRRVIFFCSCVSPTNLCHRHWVAPHVFELAEPRSQPVTIVEWPGFESEPGVVLPVATNLRILRSLEGGRASVPLGTSTPQPQLMGLPWYTPVDLLDEKTGETFVVMLTGPAQHRAGGWQMLVLGAASDLDRAIEKQKAKREALMVLPRSWPANRPAQAPFKWA